MYRFILSLILAFSFSAPQIYASDIRDVFIQDIPHTLGEFGLRAKQILNSIHKKNISECSDLIEILAPEEASVQESIDSVFYSYLQKSGVIPSNEPMPIAVQYYTLYSSNNTEDTCIKAKEIKTLIKALRTYSQNDIRLDVDDYRTIIYNLCISIFTKKIFLCRAMSVQELQGDHFNYAHNVLESVDLGALSSQSLLLTNINIQEIGNRYFINGLNLTTAPHLVTLMGQLKNRAIYSICSYNFTADQHFRSSPEREKALYMANISSYLSSRRIHFPQLTAGWIERYKASTAKPSASRNKHKKKNKGANSKAVREVATSAQEADAQPDDQFIQYKVWMAALIPTLESTFERAGYTAEERNSILTKFHQVTVDKFGGNLKKMTEAFDQNIALLKKENETLQAAHAASEKELKLNAAKITKLENLIRALEEEQLPAKDKKISRLEAKKDKAEKALNESQEKLVALKDELADALEKNKELNKRVQVAEQKAQLLEEIKAELTEKSRALKDAEKTEKRLVNRVAMLESKEQNQATLIAELQQKLAQQEQVQQVKAALILEQQQKLAQQTLVFQQEMTQFDKHMNELRSKNRQLYEAAVLLNQEKNKLEADNKTLAEVNINLRADLLASAKAAESLQNALAQRQTTEDAKAEGETIYIVQQIDFDDEK